MIGTISLERAPAESSAVIKDLRRGRTVLHALPTGFSLDAQNHIVDPAGIEQQATLERRQRGRTGALQRREHSLGAMTHGTAMVKSFRTKNTYSATSVDQLPHQLVAHLMYGHQLLVPVPDIDRTQLFVVVGGNPMASNGSLMTVPDFPGRLRELRRRGGRMVVLDPRRTETAKAADEHHFVRPGSDAFVLLAIVVVVALWYDSQETATGPTDDGVTLAVTDGGDRGPGKSSGCRGRSGRQRSWQVVGNSGS